MEEKLFEEFVEGLDRKSLEMLLKLIEIWIGKGRPYEAYGLYVSMVLDEMKVRHDP